MERDCIRLWDTCWAVTSPLSIQTGNYMRVMANAVRLVIYFYYIITCAEDKWAERNIIKGQRMLYACITLA